MSIKKTPVEWISEPDAAKMMNYQPMTLRRYVQSGKLPINFTRVNYKTFEYNKVDIDNFKINNSTLLN